MGMFNPQAAYGQTSGGNLNGIFAQLSVGVPQATPTQQQQSACPLLANVTYMINPTTATPGTATFQELGFDGTWRALAVPAPIALVNGTPVNNVLPGMYHGVRVSISGATTGATFIELKGEIH